MLQSNEYFSGKVKSIGFSSSSTGRASVGVMVEGEYTFSTAEPEEMTRPTGKCMKPVRCLMFPVTASFICKLPNPPLICAAICNSSPSP